MSQSTRRWSHEEDQILLRHIEAFPHNLARCFMTVSEQTGRSKAAVASHWYTKLSKDPQVLLYATISKHHVAKNRKNGLGVESTPSIWQRFIRLIRGL